MNPVSPPPTLVLDGSGTSGGTAAVAAVPAVTTESTGKSAVSSSASDGTAAAKSSPLAQAGLSDRQALEQRLYLDPTTAAELRQALGAGGGALAPDALERGAAALRARARVLDAQARALRAISRAP
jgi:hypothetical protein